MPVKAPPALRAQRARNVRSLRAEARLFTVAGAILLALGFPLTLTLAALAMAPDGVSPFIAAAVGAPFILSGWAACAYASERLARAAQLERG